MNLEIPNKFRGVLATAYGAAEVVIRPFSRKYDLAEHTFPAPLKLLSRGLDGMNAANPGAIGGSIAKVDKKEKGVNKNGANMSSCLNIQGIGYGDVGMLLTFPGQGLGNAAIGAVATPEQLERFGGKWASMAITEPNFGSDSAAVGATAVRDGDDFILNGEKIFVTAGERCDVIVVWATLDKSLGRAAIKSFIVEQGRPGMRIDRVEKKLGIRASDTAAIVFTDCRVPATNILGSPDIDLERGFAGVMETFDNTRPFVGAMSLGTQQATLTRTKEILQKTGKVDLEDFKTPINKAPAAQAEFLRMEADYEAGRLLVTKAAWMADNRDPNTLEASVCKAKAGRCGTNITLKCIELVSSLGYSHKELIEKWGRDSKILDIFEGTQQIQQLIIARRLLGKSSKDLK